MLRRQWGASKAMGKMAMGRGNTAPAAASPRWFSESRRLYAVKPVLLADIGEGELLLAKTVRKHDNGPMMLTKNQSNNRHCRV